MQSLHAFLDHLFLFFLHLGGLGLFIVSSLDSSVLFLPLGNDLLIVSLTAHKHQLWFYFVALATAGSVLGCFITDLISREAGVEGLEKRLPKKRIEYVKRKVEKRAGWALALACLAPPPFPFTPFIVVTAALGYPVKKLLSIVAVFRFIRFTGDAVLAVFFGKSILAIAKSPAVYYGVLALVVISVGGSAYSLVTWYRRSRSVAGGAAAGGQVASERQEGQ